MTPTTSDKDFEEQAEKVLDALSEASGIPRHMLRVAPAEDVEVDPNVDQTDQPADQFDCKGSIVLGTGCKRCNRCKQALFDLGDPSNKNTAHWVGEAEASFRRLFAWIAAGPFDANSSPITRAGFTAEHMTQSPAGEFYHIRNPNIGFIAYLRPDAAACFGWLKRIDLRGEASLHKLNSLARVDDVGVGVDVRPINPDADCSQRRSAAGLPAPRFCARCGLGPCQARVGEVRGPDVPGLPQRSDGRPGQNATVVRQDDRWLAAIRLEILHAMPELTGRQINGAAFAAVVAMKRVLNA